MEKNIIVTDKDDNEIGLTYPKRAKGLVKHGRAEFVADCKIRLLYDNADYSAPINTEENIMSNVINFNAREFKFDKSCDKNVGVRAFITTSFGNTEVYEIGDWCWSWSQIYCEKKLEKNTDYVFRFAMTGGYNDTYDAVSLAEIYALDGYENQTDAWENRFSYALQKSRFEPAVSKRDKKNGLLRVFEIPFNSGESENWRFVLIAQHAVACFFAPRDISEYDTLEDFTYEQWRSERENVKPKPEWLCQSVGKSQNENNCVSSWECSEYTDQQFAVLLSSFSDGQIMNFSNITVFSDDNDDFYDIGEAVDGFIISFENITITAKAFSMLINKLGDGCVVNIENATITDEGKLYFVREKVDGMVIAMNNVTMPKRVSDILYKKQGDGCVINLSNISYEA